jgi:hypothetical protein
MPTHAQNGTAPVPVVLPPDAKVPEAALPAARAASQAGT